jgi:hypothetical protein
VLLTWSSERYIDQCQELLDAPSTSGERKDLELYSSAVRTATGEVPDWIGEIPKEFIAYVEYVPNQYLDGRKDVQPSFNYERWLGSAG